MDGMWGLHSKGSGVGYIARTRFLGELSRGYRQHEVFLNCKLIT